jgi:hypothetical protein
VVTHTAYSPYGLVVLDGRRGVLGSIRNGALQFFPRNDLVGLTAVALHANGVVEVIDSASGAAVRFDSDGNKIHSRELLPKSGRAPIPWTVSDCGAAARQHDAVC